MNCRSVGARLSAYLDGELTGQEMFCIRDHLNVCSVCRDELQSLRLLKSMIGTLQIIEPNPGLDDRIIAQLASPRRKRIAAGGFQSAVLFAGVAGLAMFATLEFVGSSRVEVSPSMRRVRVAQSPGIDFEVKRDEMTSAISDPIAGAPVWSAADSR